MALARRLLVVVLVAACGDPSDDAVSETTTALTGEDNTITVSAAGTVLNKYSALTANAVAGTTTLTVNAVAELDGTSVGIGPLAIGDELMVIQMRGATINSTNTSSYGLVTSIGNAGLYEFVNVAAINGNVITITSADCGGLKNSYAIAGKAQVVRVPQPQTLTVNAGASIAATAWNGTTGGVVALHVGGTATLNGNGIDVSSLGFRGGAIDTATSGTSTAFVTATNTLGGEKGEGIAGDATTYDGLGGRFGKGAPANGGGGGNAKNAGGGGGANGNNGNAYTGAGVMDGTVVGNIAWNLDPENTTGTPAGLTNSSGGGRGGYTQSLSNEDATSPGRPPGSSQWGGDTRRNEGGRGGHPVDNDVATRLFMGGGGGAGEGTGVGAGAGGNGGGIVVVIANTVTGTATLKANGGLGGTAAGADGPGGGGAGGSIVVRANSLSGISAQANGAFGGNQTSTGAEAEGPGGGGGGGFIAVAGGSLVSATATGAAGGTTASSSLTEFPTNGATKGATGVSAGTIATVSGCFSDLTVLVTDSQDPVNSGSNLTWTLAVTNGGQNTASGITVTQTLPAGVTFQSATGTGWSCSFTSPAVTCTRATAAVGASPDISVTVNVTLPSGTLTTSATVTGTTGEFSSANNSDSENTQVDAVNDPPVNTVPGAQTTAEDTPKSIAGVSISDPDAGAAQVQVTLSVTNGNLTIGTVGLVFSVGDGTQDATMTFQGTIAQINTALASLQFRPNANFNGGSIFTIQTDDLGNTGVGGAKTDTDTIAITVTSVNDPPDAVNDSRTVAEDSGTTAMSPLGNDTFSPDLGETLTITAVTQPANGTAVIVGGTNINFTPAANFNGATSFNYTISDGNGGTDTATVSVTVTSVNDSPNAINDTATVAEDSGATTINVRANDSIAPDTGETLTVTAVSQPAQGGTAAIGGGGTNVTFTPAANFNGTVAFTYTISDGNGGVDTATVTVTITAVNDPPTAANDTKTVAEDSAATTISVLANDSVAPDIGETLQVTAVTQPANGTAAVGAGATSVTFTPAANFNGSTSFSYTISDGNGGTATASVAVTVTSVNDPPTAAGDTLTVAEDAPATTVLVLANDSSAPDVGETLRVVSVTQPANGTVTIGPNGANVAFQPTPNFNGSTSFSYTMSDGNGGSASASVAVTVDPAGDPPTAKDDVFVVPENSAALPLDVLANDTALPDVGETLTITQTTQPEHGVVAIIDNGTKVTFDPEQGFTGLTQFTYTITDGTGVDTATVVVGIGADSDGDTLPDDFEEQIGTNPNDKDTDDDGVQDNAEPDFDQDTDGDGLINALDPDSDNDGLYDGTELGLGCQGGGTDPGKGHCIADADSTTKTDPLDADSDDGGVEDGAEDINRNGKVESGETDPDDGSDDDDVVDSDGDGIPDAQESALATDPNDKDSDDDGVEDGAEPNYADDTDGDGKINARDSDSDNDGLNDGTELGVTTAGADTNIGAGQFIADTDSATTTSAVSRDTDRGGVSDGEEDANHNGKVDAGERDPNDKTDDIIPPSDADADGLADDNDNCPNVPNGDQADADLDEIGDACDSDANGDGLNDGLEAGGGGCSTSNGAGLVVGLALLLTLRRRRVGVVIALALVVAIPRVAAAQATGEPKDFSVERFQLASDRLGVLGVEWGEGRGHLAIDAALWIGYANDPLVVYMDNDNRVGPLVESRTAGALTASISPISNVTLGVELPVVFSQDRPQNSAISEMLFTLKGGVGNLRLIPKLVLLDQAHYGIGMAITPAVMLPSASSDKDYLADDGAVFAPEVDLSRSLTGWRFAANVGYYARHESKLLDLVVDDEIFTRLGVGYRFGDSGGPPIGLDAALSMAVAANDPFGSKNQTHVEILGGANVMIMRTAIVFAAAGFGADHGYGTPDYRVLAGVRIGTPDRKPEETLEGPPKADEGDDDGDGIANWRDECKSEPEDKDGFKDEDGCPEPDNDKDSVPDKTDKCPDEAGVPENNGCPAVDTDVDGLFDHVDKCPAEAEDFDGYQDDDGCPEPDNDGDGVLDAQDVCPSTAGSADNSGCPDPDGDGDGVVDRLDNCPAVKGQPQFAGCTAKQLVVLTAAKIAVSEEVGYYQGVIQRKSYKILDNIAAVLVAQDKLTIEIGVYADAGKDDKKKDANLVLTQKEADLVVAYLVKKGVAATRLKGVGYGEDPANGHTVFKITGGNKPTPPPAAPTPAPAPTP